MSAPQWLVSHSKRDNFVNGFAFDRRVRWRVIVQVKRCEVLTEHLNSLQKILGKFHHLRGCYFWDQYFRHVVIEKRDWFLPQLDKTKFFFKISLFAVFINGMQLIMIKMSYVQIDNLGYDESIICFVHSLWIENSTVLVTVSW